MQKKPTTKNMNDNRIVKKPTTKNMNDNRIVKKPTENTTDKNLPDVLVDNYEKELKTILNQSEIDILRKNLLDICITKDHSHANTYMSYVINEIRKFNNNKHNLTFEAQLSDKIYNQFACDDDSENINGRLLAANLMKFDKIIEQNNEIIKLLKGLND